MIDARVVIDAARDPTRVTDLDDQFLQIHSAPPRSVSFAIAGARGVGKTAFVRRFFSECRRGARTVGRSSDDDDDAAAAADDERSSSWRSTPTIGMDYGAVTLAPMRARGRFYDPSGAVAHAACRAEAFRAADAVVFVVGDDDDDARAAIEETIDEIIRAREGASDDDDDADADARVGGVRVAFARTRRSRPSRRDVGDVDGRVERENSSDARLNRVIRAVIDARRQRTIGGGDPDDDDVRFVVDDAARARGRPSDAEENHPTTTTTSTSTPTRPRGHEENNSFFTIDASTGLGVRRVVLALARAVHPTSSSNGIGGSAPVHIVPSKYH